MVGLLARGLQQPVTDLGTRGEGGLTVIERLRSHLPGMVDPHQAGRVAPFGVGQRSLGQGRIALGAGHRPVRVGRREHGAERPIKGAEDRVEEVAFAHGTL